MNFVRANNGDGGDCREHCDRGYDGGGGGSCDGGGDDGRGHRESSDDGGV